MKASKPKKKLWIAPKLAVYGNVQEITGDSITKFPGANDGVHYGPTGEGIGPRS